MLYSREDTTSALMRDLRQGRLDLVIGFCAARDDALERERLRDEPAVVHLADSHPLAERTSVRLEELSDQTFIVAGGPDSPGYTRTVVDLCRAAGFEPKTEPDPYPDLGQQAVREGIGIVLYVRTAFGPAIPGSRFIPLEGGVTLPFDLLWRRGVRSGALDAALGVARELRQGRSERL